MPIESDDFFKGKRPWSNIKDRILGSYINPYLAKIVRRGQPILLIDGFAGPGKFEDGQPGSPLIMCSAAEKYAKGRYRAIFVNEKPEYHEQLDGILRAGGWRSSALPVLGDSKDFLTEIAKILTNQSVFLYLDPFGLKDCDFSTLKPFLNRNPLYSTEIVINLCAPILHRLAAREAFLNGTGDPSQISTWHSLLTRTLGGDYWKEILLSENKMDAKAREQLVIEEYKRQLSSTNYLTFTGSCPIQATREGRTKYYMIFASPHQDAMVLFNDEMCKAFNEYMHEEETQNTLFSGQHWTSWRDTDELEKIVIEYINKLPGKTRKELWYEIVKDHFMRFTSSEYKKAVLQALEIGSITSPTPRKTKKLNDDCVLLPTPRQNSLF